MQRAATIRIGNVRYTTSGCFLSGVQVNGFNSHSEKLVTHLANPAQSSS